jgi:glycosyltransferase 2 family protein
VQQRTAQESARPLATRPVWRAVRIAVAVGLLALLLTGVDWPIVLGHIERMTPAVVLLVIIAFAVQLAVSSWKWQWALRIHELNFPYAFLTRVLVIGFFLNNFLPTSIGGDAYRVYRTLPPTPPKSRAISAVLLERVVGLVALLLLGLAGAVALFSSNDLARAYVTLAAAGTAVFGAAVLLMWLRTPRLPQSRWLAPIAENLRTIATARSAWLPLIGISLLFQAQAILIIFELFRALDVHVTLSQTALIAAAAGIAAIIPFSINGLGIVEATFAGTAVAVGVSYEAGLLVALLIRVLVIPLTLLAGLVYAFEPVHVRDLSTSIPNVRSSG